MPKRLAVLGNCQAASLAACVRKLNPSLDVKVVLGARTGNSQARERAFRILDSADAIFAQPGGGLSDRFPDSVKYPKLTFAGFHPDFCYLRDGNGTMVRSPGGNYHSVITAAAFLAGVSEDRVPNLFNSFIFARLGYFDKFAAWKDVFLSRALEIGYDLEEDFASWLKQGAFMHTSLHPAIRVIASVAARAMAKANINVTERAPELRDGLAKMRLPVFPDIARAIGIAPAPCFQIVGPANRHNHCQLQIEQFVQECFATYRKSDPGIFETNQITLARSVLAQAVKI